MNRRFVLMLVARLSLFLLSALLTDSRCRAQGAGITASQATSIARGWVGEAGAEMIRPTGSHPEHDRLARALASWSVDLRTSDGWRHGVQVDALTGIVLSWAKYGAEVRDSATEPHPVLTLTESLQVAEAFAAERCAAFATGRWMPALGSPRKGQMSYQWAWDEVVDTRSGALGPSELFVEVSDQAPEVITFWRPAQAPITISTRPSIDRAMTLAIARRFAILNPALCPINHLTLRVQMDEYGSQRLVWECLQVLDVSIVTGALAYGVVFDAHTGEPLYPIAPMGGSKHPVRQISFPNRSSVRAEPGGRTMTTALVPPVLDQMGLWLRAEHLRAAEGLHVDADRNHLSVRIGDRTISGEELGAKWRDYGWWVPLRRAAKALGWRVAWNNAKKEAVIFHRAAPLRHFREGES